MKPRSILLIALAAAIGLYLWNKRMQVMQIANDTADSAVAIENTVQNTIEEAAVNFSQNALNLIRKMEGLSLTAFPDAGGYSIGYGHYMGPKPTMTDIDTDKAETLLMQDTDKADAIIARYVTVPLTQNQHDAIVSAVFNLGTALFWNAESKTKTKFLNLLNSGDYAGAADQLTRFVNSQGKVLPALVTRRETEKQLFLTA